MTDKLAKLRRAIGAGGGKVMSIDFLPLRSATDQSPLWDLAIRTERGSETGYYQDRCAFADQEVLLDRALDHFARQEAA